MFIFQFVIGHFFLTMRASFPVFFRAFIAAYMNIFGWKQGQYFIHHILQKCKSIFLPCTKYIIKHSPCLLHLFANTVATPFTLLGKIFYSWFAGKATQFRIGCNSRRSMAGHFYFRNNIDVSVCRILYYFFYLLLCVEAAVFYSIITSAGVAANDSAVSPSTHRSKFGIFFYFNAPALVVSKVPVKSIEFMQSQVINIFF